MSKVILISQVPLPYSKIGSWTTLYRNYLENNHRIDAIVCPKPNKLFREITYSFVKLTLFHKLKRRFLNKKKLEYLEALDKLIVPNQKYIFQVIDNYGMVKPLKNYLISKGVEQQSYIQFFYHGFPPYVNEDCENDFYKIVDELILLTNDSYNEFKKKIKILPPHFSILYNGIDNQNFVKVSISQKIKLKDTLGFGAKKVFIWCSRDKPKKGLDLILDVWRKVYNPEKNIILVVIGNDAREYTEGVSFLGKIDNDLLPKYFQASDCYLFPTLCEEGFGLSLIEALHCGNYCIASALGGVPEVLQYGKLGKLIRNPHDTLEWENAIKDFLKGNFEYQKIAPALYSMENWHTGMNTIIDNAKSRIISNSI